MQNNSQKLGRGISALISGSINPDNITNNSVVKDIVKSIRIEKIIAGVYQPRTFFSQQDLEDLSRSITENGIVQPIIVRKANHGDFYEIIAGERRFRASKMAGLNEIPAIVKDISNEKALEFAIIENVQRADLSGIEEAKGYKQLMDEFRYTQEQVANKVGKSRSYIANIIRLLTLPVEVQKMIENKSLSTSHGRSLIGKENPLLLAKEIIDNGLSVQEVESLEKSYKPRENSKIKKEPVLEDKEKRALRKEYLKTLENSISSMSGNLKVKASYDGKKGKGRVTIFFNEFEEIENLIHKLEK